MAEPKGASQYGGMAKALHWGLAVLIIFMLIGGHQLEDLAPAFKSETAKLHTGVGLVILGLAIARVLWRWRHPVAPVEGLRRWEIVGSKTVHVALYGLMLMQPLVGIAMAAFATYPVEAFGVIEISALARGDNELYEGLRKLHALGFLLLSLLILVHLLASLRHHFLKRNIVLKRMLPFTRS